MSMRHLAEEVFRKPSREETRKSIRKILGDITKRGEYQRRLPEDVVIGLGRHSGQFVGSFPAEGFPGKRYFVSGPTREGVEQAIAKKLNIEL